MLLLITICFVLIIKANSPTLNFIIIGSHTETVFALGVGTQQSYCLIDYFFSCSWVFKWYYLGFIYKQITNA